MSLEAERGTEQQKEYAALQGCFVEGSAEQRAGERRIRRHALTISIAVQTAILTLIVLIPLFGKPEAIVHAFVPIPPYYHHNATPDTSRGVVRRVDDHRPCFTCPTKPLSRPTAEPITNPEATPPDLLEGISGPGPADAWRMLGSDTRPQPPAEVKPKTPVRIVTGHIEAAMLIRRVEPIYPAVAKQTHTEGRVELHAIIATDGTIQSLQVVSGHPLLLQSAIEAVRQWRYRPTILNGQPVEVDTYITVIYTFQH